MAEVFLARQTSVHGFEKMLVVKKILPHLGSQERFVEMFLDEARLAAKFNHPNVVQIYDLGQEGEIFYIAMEYIHGEDIKSIVRRCAKIKKRIPIEHIVKTFSGVLDGLNYAHNQFDLDGNPGGIVHRDVSPHNVLISFEGGVKLVDFGIAKARTQISTTIPGRVKGKHAYMSPEQCQGLNLDCRSDIFSTGVVMYELVTWTRLFKRKNDIDTLKSIVAGDVKPPRSLNPEIDQELEQIILKSLANKPDDRFQTAREMQLALEDYLLNSGMRSNSILLSNYMTDLFAQKLEARTKALEQAKVSNLEGAVLSAGEQSPDLVEFLDMFFDAAASDSESTSGSGSSSPGMNLGPEFTPSSDYTPAPMPQEQPVLVPRRTDPASLLKRKETPSKAPPPKAPDGMNVLHITPGVSTEPEPQNQTRQPQAIQTAPPSVPQMDAIVDPLAPVSVPPQISEEPWPPPDDLAAGELMPGDPNPYAEELMPTGKKGKGFLVLVFLVLAALAAGLIMMFKDTEQTSQAPETGRVQISSVPSGADVYFNDSRLPTQTPTEIGRVEPNKEHVLRVSLPNMPAWEKKFTLVDTTKPLKFEAVLSKDAAQKAKMSGAAIISFAEGKGVGEIKVTSKPSRALIYLDGVSTKRKTPTTLKKVPSELDHVIMLAKEGMQPAFERLSLKDGGKAEVNLTLEPGADGGSGRILVHVESEPEGAKVTVNGYPLKKKTPLAVKMLAKGPTELELELKGYKNWVREVRPVPNVDLTFYAKMKK
ncbi:MAG: PEGA domain-containing protein [Deltaproteobacteria bacterium]|nr:PEGA domain-containing protein [Deltaproteobacteria bacterium]